jgi:hypothetical protein
VTSRQTVPKWPTFLPFLDFTGSQQRTLKMREFHTPEQPSGKFLEIPTVFLSGASPADEQTRPASCSCTAGLSRWRRLLQGAARTAQAQSNW